MTELERMLKETLTRIEQDFSRSLAVQGTTLGEQQRALTAHIQNLRQLQEEIGQGKADLQALMRRLEDLAGLYKRLETLLPRLNSVLNGR
jgi:DNA repair exonuclease SbcCD ATPase subunit